MLPDKLEAGVRFPLQGGFASLSATLSTQTPSSAASRMNVSAYTAPERWTWRSAPFGNWSRNARRASGSCFSAAANACAVLDSLGVDPERADCARATERTASRAKRHKTMRALLAEWGRMIVLQCSRDTSKVGSENPCGKGSSINFAQAVGPVDLPMLAVVGLQESELIY